MVKKTKGKAKKGLDAKEGEEGAKKEEKKEKKEKKGKKEKKNKGGKRVKKKKLTKKEKARLATQQTEQLRQALEEERQRLAVIEKERIEKERIFLEEKRKRDIEEQAIREVQLSVTKDVLSAFKNSMQQMELDIRAHEEWVQYLKCDGLPDPASLSEMNTYLYVWRLDEETKHIQKAVPKTEEVVGLLEGLEEFIDFPMYHTPERVQAWIEVRNDVRVEQQVHLDTATYLLLRRMETDLQLLDLNVLRYSAKSNNVTFFLWSLLPLPVPGVPPEDNMGHTAECDFEELGVNIHMPKPLADSYLAIRALWVSYDHLSDLCPSSVLAAPTEENTQDAEMECIMREEWSMQETLLEQYKAELAMRNAERRACLRPFNTPSGPIYRTPDVVLTAPLKEPLLSYFEPLIPPRLDLPIPTPQEILCTKQDQEEGERKKEEEYQPRPHELNLRKYTILGGVLHLDLLQQPPQPKELKEKYTITTLKLPKTLQPYDFHVSYQPPPPPEPGVRRLPEEIEAEIKLQEAEFDKLCLVSIALPNNVLWFEPPIIAGWDDDNGYWSTEDFHDLKFSEEKQILTFRTGRMGPLGLAVFRYSNLPFQAWDLKPCHKTAGVILNITAAIAVVELLFEDDMVTMTQLQNGTTSALQELIGLRFKPRKLIKLLVRGGVDLFPPRDARCYIEGVGSKHRTMEDHLYHCLAVLSTSHQFAWSRWNLLAGHRSCVMQMREYVDRKHLPTYNMLSVTPLKACLVDCTEVGSTFSEEGIPGMKFYCDLYHLAVAHSSMTSKKKINTISYQLVESLYGFLSKTRLVSFS